MLGPLDALPITPRRIAIAGVSGAGKSTLARRLSRILQLPYTEIDSLYHGPNWTEREGFAADVDAATSGDRWVIEWQYTSQRELIAERADTLVWLDLPYRTTLGRVTGRTIRRRIRRTPLWSGNVEGPLKDFFTDPDQIIRWSIRQRHSLDGLGERLERDHPHLQVVHLTTPREVEQFVFGIGTHRGE
ncbi:AAA family ATPase [Frondihabitans sp. PAMC 28766]|uniref:(d)CMP kinase n=1 Tax=Frondihabitans sp. PAMC 28766 TaxID=1795630 RepID=UPI00078DEDFB|nr:(d)CMP kinase [Frondihabitans sp. PAMC 28766]AMM20795.1 AAA family ATPase [Frondihabitans sp. PAMC 28766]